ncbi:hypothetical protein, partial [Halomonas maura]|uniref:hypothetical protein n=1 Tax=Halomonas maura TaxID=117606 RepID=UPI0025B43746
VASGEHSTVSGEPVNRVFSKTLEETSTSATHHRLQRCPSPAADAYFTASPGVTQALRGKSFRGVTAP